MHFVAIVSPLAYRLSTLALVVAFVASTHALVPEAIPRAELQYGFVIALGYGHLIGAARGAFAAFARSPLAGAFAVVTIAGGFALYAEGVARWPGIAFALLALSVWHFTENDAALADALARRSALRSLPRGLRAQLPPLAAAAAVVALALASSEHPGLLGALFAATTLFHLVGWLVFLIARGVGRLHLLALHVPPLALCGWLAASPAESLAPLRAWVFSPAIYLFWASLHVAHTGWMRRGRAP